VTALADTMDAPGSCRADDADGIAQAVLRYLQAHPYAADTVDGIMRWWLDPELSCAQRDTVERALEMLVKSGHVTRDSLSDGRFVYRRGPRIEVDGTLGS